MSVFKIKGGRPLWGEIDVPTAKNAVLPLLAASVMIRDETTLIDCPDLSDIRAMKELLRALGVKVEQKERNVLLDASGTVRSRAVLGTDVMRSSLFLLGPLLARNGVAELGYPGGCVIGKRPIDIHLDGLRALGVVVKECPDRVRCAIRGKIRGRYRLPYPSVGATVNLLALATRAEEKVTLSNVALEPEVGDLIRFLRLSGVEIEARGDVIEVCGAPTRGLTYRPVADRIWAGTLMGAVAVAGGEVTLKGIDGNLLGEWGSKITDKCCKISYGCDTIRVSVWGEHRSRHFVTAPYPGFATDLQAMAVVYNATAVGTGLVKETVFEDRFALLDPLRRMGARCEQYGSTAVIRGGALRGATVKAPDLRAGAALVVAGLCAKGETVVEGVRLIDRGYERLQDTLARLGADIERIDER